MNISKLYLIVIVLCVTIIFTMISFKRLLYNEEQKLINRCVQSYIYAYPLVLMDATQKTMTHNGKYINTFINVSEFPTDTFKNIVRPNVDTLYSFAWLDLSYGPLILSVPDTHSRYYLVQFLDAWTNIFESIGKRTTGTTAQNFIIVGPCYPDEITLGFTKIYAPTNMVLLLTRIHTYGKKDYEAVHKIQEGFSLRSLRDWGNKSIPISALNVSNLIIDIQQAPVDQVAVMDAVTFYNIFTKTLIKNPSAPADEPIFKQLKQCGIKKNYLDDYNLTHYSGYLNRIVPQANKLAFEKIRIAKNNIKKINGWGVMLNIGTYGTDYLTRALVAYMGIGANLPEDAVYPTAFVDVNNNPLTGKHTYRIHFEKEQLPPVYAFWSITLYNSESFLVKNLLNRYAINDRDPLHFNQDGSLDIYIQYESPGTGKENNWLPAPENEFNLTMRLYWPKKEVLEGNWNPPGIVRVK